MARNDMAEMRLYRVAALNLRGLTPLEIVAALREKGITCDLELVCADIATLNAQWRAEIRNGEQNQARLLAEIRETRRAAWAMGNLEVVMDTIKQEQKLLEETPAPPPELFRL